MATGTIWTWLDYRLLMPENWQSTPGSQRPSRAKNYALCIPRPYPAGTGEARRRDKDGDKNPKWR